ncbi:MAG: HAMP domain-containing histidine kinase, partial [candidate division Zixibacteria bacterium]|nr:HAMP domain-containing histidine kinase [candidate division Zixibacteria bacterium]
IVPKHITHIFDTFYSTKPGKGTGIGLAMVKKIVEMYGGRISVSSELNQGTTFEIELRLFESSR